MLIALLIIKISGGIVEPNLSNKTVTTNRITSRDDRKVISHKEKAADIFNTFFVNTENILKIDKDKRLLAEMNDVFDTVLKVIKNNRNYGTIDI